MPYLSQFSGTQIDSAIRAVRNGMIDASIFRAKIATLSANASGILSSLSTTPTFTDLYGGDPLLLINANGQSTNFFLDLLEGQILTKGSTTIPIRDDLGGSVDITAFEGDGVYLEGSILFDRFNDFNELIELQNISISNLGNSLLLNNSVGVIGVLLEDYLEVVDQGTLLVNLYLDLAGGNTFTLLDTDNFTLVECTVTTGVTAGGNKTLNIEPISGSFLEGQPLGLGGETFMASIQLDRDRINLLSSTITNSGSIAETTAEVDFETEIPITGLTIDLAAGAKLQIVFPNGALGPIIELSQDIDAGQSPLVVGEAIQTLIPSGSFIHLESSYFFSQITLDPTQINLIVSDYLSESFVTIESDKVTLETPAFGNAAWFVDGVMSQAIGEEGHIHEFSAQEGAWIITSAAHFQFQQNATNYFRSFGAGFEFRGKVYGATGVIIDDDGHVDDTIDSGPIKSGAIVASKLYKAAQKYSTDLEITPDEPHSTNTIYISGTYIHPNDGEIIDISVVWGAPGDTLTLLSSRNYIFYDLDTEQIAISNDPDVLNRQDILFLATAWLGKDLGSGDIEPPTIFFPVSRSIYGSDSIAAKSITADMIRANIIEAIHIQSAAITGDHISAIATIEVGLGDPVGGNPGIIILSGTGNYRILAAQNKEDIVGPGSDPTNANFRLTDEGKLYATGAVISGTLHAENGSISGPLDIGGILTMGVLGVITNANGDYTIDEEGIRFQPGANVYPPLPGSTLRWIRNDGPPAEILSIDPLLVGTPKEAAILRYAAQSHTFQYRDENGDTTLLYLDKETVRIPLAALPETDPNSAGQLFRDGTDLRVSIG